MALSAFIKAEAGGVPKKTPALAKVPPREDKEALSRTGRAPARCPVIGKASAKATALAYAKATPLPAEEEPLKEARYEKGSKAAAIARQKPMHKALHAVVARASMDLVLSLRIIAAKLTETVDATTTPSYKGSSLHRTA